MQKVFMLVAGLILVVIAVVVLVSAASGDFVSALGQDLGWAEPYLRVAAILFGGLSLAASLVLIGVGLGRWNRPVPVHDSEERRHHGLSE